ALAGREFADQVTAENYPIRLSPGGMSAADEFKPTVARNLRVSAFYAIFLALVFIIVYIWFRFRKISFGIGTVVALVHDIFIALAAIAIFDSIPGIDVKLDMPIVAALLTIIGYSLNDTIVVFDRIRENMGLHRDERYYAENINNSINQTLSRTIWTSATTFFVAFSLAILGGESLRGFAVILCVGILVGTYSSIFIASPIVSWLHKRELKDKSTFVFNKKKANPVTPG
ncbi:MAG: protein translocase subunit SecF, partial [Phycisphaerae bacterium]|nr:protein translocase subunit SecF [Phycisphaerae bacterium]